MNFNPYLVKTEIRFAARFGPEVEQVVAELLGRKPWLCCISTMGSVLERFEAMTLLDVAGAEYLGYSERTKFHQVELMGQVYHFSYMNRAGQIDLCEAARKLMQDPVTEHNHLLCTWVLR